MIVGWPRKRGRPTHTVTVEQVEKFRQAQQAIPMMSPDQHFSARTMTGTTNFQPRDLLLKALYGTGFFVELPDGTKRYQMASQQNVSEILDSISWSAGTMMWRSPDGWRPIPPGQPGQVLTFISDEDAPMWLDPGAESATTWVQSSMFGAYQTPNDNSQRAAKGNMFVARRGLHITGLALNVTRVTGATYRASVGLVTVGGLITDVVDGDPWTAPDAGSRAEFLTVDAFIGPGENFATWITRTDAAGVVAFTVLEQNGYFTAPISLTGRVWLANPNPQAGDTFNVVATTTAPTWQSIGIQWV